MKTPLRILLLTAFFHGAVPTMCAGIDDLETAVRLALDRNPTLQAARSGAESARQAVREVEALPDPRLSLSQALEPVETRVGPQWQAVSLSQSFPWFGTLGAQGEIQDARADARSADVSDMALSLRLDVATAWWELAYTDAAIHAAEAAIAVLERLEPAVEARYGAGRGALADLLAVRDDLARRRVERDRLDNRRAVRLAVLNALLDRHDGAPATPVLPDAVPADRTIDHGGNHPRLEIWRHRADAARAGAHAATLSGRPDLTIGLTWLRHGSARMDGVMDDGRDALTATLAMTLPFRRGPVHAAERRAALDLEVAEAAGRAAANDLRTLRAEAAYRTDDARRGLDLHDGTLLPSARQALASVRASHEAGEAGPAALARAELTLLDLRLARSRALADLLIAVALTDRATAAPFAGGTP